MGLSHDEIPTTYDGLAWQPEMRKIHAVSSQHPIRRKADAEDGRKIRVYISAKGRRVHDRFSAVAEARR